MSDYPTCAKCGDVIRDGGTYVAELSHQGEGEWWECSGCASYVEESNEETANQED